mgnify:CR=1 FL=1
MIGLTKETKVALKEYYTSPAAIEKIRLDAGFREEILKPLMMARRSPATLALISRTIEQKGMDPIAQIHESEELLGERTHPLTLYLLAEEAAWKELVDKFKALRNVLEGLCNGKISEEKLERLPKNAKQSIAGLIERPYHLLDEIKNILKIERAYLPLTDKQIEAHIALLEKTSDALLAKEAEVTLEGAYTR